VKLTEKLVKQLNKVSATRGSILAGMSSIRASKNYRLRQKSDYRLAKACRCIKEKKKKAAKQKKKTKSKEQRLQSEDIYIKIPNRGRSSIASKIEQANTQL